MPTVSQVATADFDHPTEPELTVCFKQHSCGVKKLSAHNRSVTRGWPTRERMELFLHTSDKLLYKDCTKISLVRLNTPSWSKCIDTLLSHGPRNAGLQ